jgi:uncharacterized membrane protein YqjE
MDQDYERGSPGARSGAGASGRAGGDAGGTEGIGSLISGTIRDMQDLVRAEVQLAKAELKEDAKGIGAGAGMLAAGAFVGLVGLVWLVFAAIHLVDKAIEELWLSAGIVSLVLLAIAAILAQRGRSTLRASNLKPEQTIETLREDQRWAKHQIDSVKR